MEGKLLRREGADPILSKKFYPVVVQAVLLFGGRDMGAVGSDA